MKEIRMSEEYRTGIEEIDREHEQMLDHMNRTEQLFKDENMLFKCADIRKILEELDRFATAHFATEEGYMERIGYDGLEEHRRQHAAFHEKIRDFIERIPKLSLDTQDEMLGEALVYLHNWWRGHIRTEDRKYVEFGNGPRKE